jgi:hypothetical protein
MPELSRSFQAGYALQAVLPGEAARGELVLEKLKPYKATVGNSREHSSVPAPEDGWPVLENSGFLGS